MILIYTGKTTNRLRYIFEHILKYVLGLKVKFTTNIEEFNQHTGAKINYSSRAIPNKAHTNNSGSNKVCSRKTTIRLTMCSVDCSTACFILV